MKLQPGKHASAAVGSIWLYVTIAYGLAWTLWTVGWLITKGALSLPLFPVLVVGSFAPFIGAAAVSLHEGGARQALQFFGRALQLRMGWMVFLVSVFLLPAAALVIEFLHARVTHSAPRFTMTISEVPLNYLFLFVVGGTLAEEFGWSLLSDKLDELVAPAPSTFLLGVIWALWHLPLFFIITPGAIQGYTPFPLFLLTTVSMRFLFSWAYHRGGRSILSNMLFHTASNMAYSIVPLAPSPDDMSTGRLWMFAAFNVVCAALLWGFGRRGRFVRGSSQAQRL